MLRRLAAAAAFDAFWVGHVVDSGRLIKREERKKERKADDAATRVPFGPSSNTPAAVPLPSSPPPFLSADYLAGGQIKSRSTGFCLTKKYEAMDIKDGRNRK